MSEFRQVSSNPHIRSKNTTNLIMLLVIISLLPSAIFGIYHFGFRAAVIIIITVLSCVISEVLFQWIAKRKQTVGDFSAIVTGLLLAMNLPATVPWWICVIGGSFAIIVVKMAFGGIGKNFMNPALGARCFLVISFASTMTNFNVDTMSGATPLAVLKAGDAVVLKDMVVGNIQGTIGETSVIALLLGASILLFTRVIDLRIPATYLISFIIFIVLFSGKGLDIRFIVAHLSGGGLMLGAFFMATDYSTRPITVKGQYVFGICLGLLTGLFRLFGASAEGVSYAIIISNLLVPLIESFTLPKEFGKGGERV